MQLHGPPFGGIKNPLGHASSSLYDNSVNVISTLGPVKDSPMSDLSAPEPRNPILSSPTEAMDAFGNNIVDKAAAVAPWIA